MRLLKLIRHSFEYVKYLGFLKGIDTFRRLQFGFGTVRLFLRGYPYPIFIRKKTADLVVFEHVLMKNEYQAALPDQASCIIDAGANIGLSTLYFAHRFPKACVIALEPESSNFELLQLNTRQYQNVICVKAALWSHRTSLRITNVGMQTHAFQVTENDEPNRHAEGDIDAIDLWTVIERYAIDRIDLLKIDIEGSEIQIFTQPPPWIGRVDRLAIELHEHLRRGATFAVYNAMQDFGKAFRTHEYDVFVR